MQPRTDVPVPRALRVMAAIGWRLLVVAAAALAVIALLVEIRLVVLPVIAALLVTTVLRPPVRWLCARGWRPLLATWAVLVGALSSAGALAAAFIPQAADELGEVDERVREGIAEVNEWLQGGPFGLPEDALQQAVDRASGWLSAGGGGLAGRVAEGAALAVEVLAGTFLALVLVFFFIKDGERIWRWVSGLWGPRLGPDVDAIGRRAWSALGAFMRGTAIVALVDAVLIAIVLLVLGVPLVAPLALLTFLAAFFPLIGAVLAGVVAALVALVTEGVTDALIVTAAIVVIQQVEGDVLQPIVLGRAVRLHPVAIVLSLTAGAALAGVVGAFLAVPTAAVSVAVGSYLRHRPPDLDRPSGERPEKPGPPPHHAKGP